MGIDQDREHAKGFIVLNETHAAHVCGEVVDDFSPNDRLFTGLLLLKIETDIFDIGEDLVPFGSRLNIDGANIFVALPAQIGNQMTANKSAAAANDNFACTHKWNFQIIS